MEKQEIIDALRGWFDREKWKYERSREDALLTMDVPLKGKLTAAHTIIDIKDDGYLVYVHCPVKGRTGELGELMKYLMLANHNLINGNFELDIDDGEIRYKTYVDCDGLDELPDAVIRDSFHIAIQMMEQYGDGIAALALGFSDAETEIEKAE